MKRSSINRSVETAKEVFAQLGIHLPPFAFWTAEDWAGKGPEADEIRDCMLGWDVTDFGQGDFPRIGRTLFTVRNGCARKPGYPKVYCEKFILDPEDQRPPLHYHHRKMEDIVNRGGGNIVMTVFKAGADGRPSQEGFTLRIDGVTRSIKPGDLLRLQPGQSVCLPPGILHQFWGEAGTGVAIGGSRCTVSGEVSSVCDDWDDNVWLEPCERYCQIEDDERPHHLLVHEYPAAQ